MIDKKEAGDDLSWQLRNVLTECLLLTMCEAFSLSSRSREELGDMLYG